ncbi:transposase, partial [Candidatus Poribacteria bacterium]|nr:transposase [Candidatus Poribacteria bacterium]
LGYGEEDFLRDWALPVKGMIMHHDQDSVYTGHMWTRQLLLRDKVRLSYALDGAKDNTEMESFNGHFKQEGNSLFLDADDIEELKAVVSRQMKYYNTRRRHSSLVYVSPMAYIESMLSDGKEEK